ncbi:unnamed protein product [Lymnaea stagnalis]|uniref:EF-hand domain-containing protein n=1 Tax=Lymnaea stagnalis TaxID=6523 RepID=A0AAV2I322_LYMST
MRLRFRGRCPLVLRDYIIKCLTILLVGVKLCQRHIYGLVCVVVIITFVWWNIGDGTGCAGTQIVENVCLAYQKKEVSGDLCDSLCNSNEIEIGSCINNADGLKIFQSANIVFTVQSETIRSWEQDKIEEGTLLRRFIHHIEEFLKSELGNVDTSTLINKIIEEFDLNRDGKINLGEAQSMWRLIKLPYFLVFYNFQGHSAVPHLNGTCGGISVWHRPQMTLGTILYRRATPWPISLFTSNAYRWTLPNWYRRAKVMLSLLEFVEDINEKDGVRYYLCNANGMTLSRLPNYEIVISEETMLLSSHQVIKKLSNVTCYHSDDCVLTPQCKTTCDVSNNQCTGTLVRPTAAHICDIMEDYLLFDAPRLLKPTLTRLIHRCQAMNLRSPKLDLLHSVVIIDIKSVLWNTLQYLQK